MPLSHEELAALRADSHNHRNSLLEAISKVSAKRRTARLLILLILLLLAGAILLVWRA